MVDTKQQKSLPGGGFVMSPLPTGGIFSREKMSEDSLEICDEFRKFFENEVLTRLEEIETKAYTEVDGKKMAVSVQILKEAGELGMLSAEIPDEYEGLGLDVTTAALLSEYTGGCASFAVTMGAHSGIGTLPIVYFGNDEQKAKYLPPLSTAEIVSCYALTEPNSGSDALSGRTTGVLSDCEKYYVVNGEKTFISNGKWADLAIVFTRIDGLYSCLIVDLHSEGVSRGAEEIKMGQLGSSTTSLIFEDVKVPVENLLGELGDASKIALNILNLGRLKLGFGCLGTSKYALNKGVKYGLERKQFSQPIATFDMQKARIAQMTTKIYAVDSVAYRVAGDIDAMIENDKSDDKQKAKVSAVRAHALESSIAKILGSETLHYVAQNAVFMHGGYGYLAEYQVERVYRDNIVDMIYEGTNDINRMVIFQDFVRNLYSAQVPFRESVEALDLRIRKEAFEPEVSDEVPACLRDAAKRVQAAKDAMLYSINHCLIHCGKNVRNEQQVMREISDGLIQIYAMESTLARVCDRIGVLGERSTGDIQAIAKLAVHDGVRAVQQHAEEALLAAVEGPEMDAKMAVLGKLLAHASSRVAVARLKRVVADAVLENGGYPF